MKTIIKQAAVIAILLSVTGCSSLTDPARKRELKEDTQYWFNYDASRRGTLFVQRSDGRIAVVSEPSPDVALEILGKLKATVSKGDVDVGAETEFNNKVIDLSRRSQTILFLRESLYRLSEMAVNFDVPAADAQKLYEQVIKAAVDMAASELNDSKRAADEAQRRLIETQARIEKAKAATGKTMDSDLDKISTPTPPKNP